MQATPLQPATLQSTVVQSTVYSHTDIPEIPEKTAEKTAETRWDNRSPSPCHHTSPISPLEVCARISHIAGHAPWLVNFFWSTFLSHASCAYPHDALLTVYNLAKPKVTFTQPAPAHYSSETLIPIKGLSYNQQYY